MRTNEATQATIDIHRLRGKSRNFRRVAGIILGAIAICRTTPAPAETCSAVYQQLQGVGRGNFIIEGAPTVQLPFADKVITIKEAQRWTFRDAANFGLFNGIYSSVCKDDKQIATTIRLSNRLSQSEFNGIVEDLWDKMGCNDDTPIAKLLRKLVPGVDTCNIYKSEYKVICLVENGSVVTEIDVGDLADALDDR